MSRPLRIVALDRTYKRPLVSTDSRRNGQVRACETCGTHFYARPCEDAKSAGGRRRFCARPCQLASYKGAGNPKWRGGTVRQVSGYIYEYAPDHPHATDDGYVMQHRLVVERSIGRVIDPVEQVHHINHVRDDNRLENLRLMADVHEHRVHHAYYEPAPCGTCGTEVLRSAAHRRRWSRAFCSRRCAALAASAANVSKARAS